MANSPVQPEALVPAAMIRRFDVFAEYNRIKNERKGMPPDQAKGYALWLAKIIARRKFATTPEARARVAEVLRRGREQMAAGNRYPTLDGVPQTGEMFDREIVERMGRQFYCEVFSPAIEAAIADHQSYERIRDALRVPWNLRRMAA